MEKRTLLAVVFVVLAGAAAFFVMRAPEKGQRQGPPPRPVAVMKALDMNGLEIWNDKQEHTVLEKQADGWHVTQPGQWKADANAVKMLTDALEKVTFGDVVTDQKAKHDEMGVADGKATRLMVKGTGKTLADLYVGKTVNGYTMVRVNGKDDVWQASGLAPYAVNKAPKDWRDHTIFELVAGDADKLTVESAGSKLVLEKVENKDAKPGDQAKWKIAESTGNGPKTSDGLDEGQINAAVQTFATLHANDFADDKKKDDVQKSATVTVTLSVKGTPHTLFVGTQTGDDFSVVTSDSPQVYTVKKYAVDHVAKKPIDYRDKTLVKAAAADIAGVTITVGSDATTLTAGKDGKWTAQKGTADDTKVKPVIGAFANLQADSFSDEKDFAKTGLAKPMGDVIVRLKDKKTVALKIGALKDQDYFVQKSGSPDVYMVKKFAVDRFLKKPADLIKR